MKVACSIFLVVAISLSFAKRSKKVLPVCMPASVPSADGACPSRSITEKDVGKFKEYFQDQYWFRSCECGGPGWNKVAFYNFTNGVMDCPTDFYHYQRLVSRAGCVPSFSNPKINNICPPDPGFYNQYYQASLAIPVEGKSYSSVCGRMRGYGDGIGFHNNILCNASLEEYYVDGLSLTHGPPGNRSHIWTFAATHGFFDSKKTVDSCPCSFTGTTWPHTVPNYIGQDYFCDSFNQIEVGGDDSVTHDPNDYLWEGQDCGPTSSCCDFKHPPYFCKHLNYTTSDDMEIRHFMESVNPSVLLIEIYIK